MRRVVSLILALAGCVSPAAAPSVHYVLGAPYQAAGQWRYPREEFSREETGLGMVVGAHGRLTADGEVFDQSLLAAAHPTLQLPALARLTNLDNGREVLVRINDRGPAAPARMLAVTRRTAELLAAVDATAIPLRLQLLEDESRHMAGALRPDGPTLPLASAPRSGVQSEALAPPPGAVQGGGVRTAPAAVAAAGPAAAVESGVPLRLPEAVVQGWVQPHQLFIDGGGFSRPEYADLMTARLAALGARTTTSYAAPRDRAYMVRIGPLTGVAAAEAMLVRAMRLGATDARIVVE